MLRRPTIVSHYLKRALCFHRSASELFALEKERHGATIGLLAVHASIALADAILASVASEDPRKRDDHAVAARALGDWCSANSLSSEGTKHFAWLLGRKSRFSYESSRVESSDFDNAKVRMDRFFAWGFRTFPEVAQLKEQSDE